MSDLTLSPDYVLTSDLKHKTLISQFENGYEQRRNKWSADLGEWHLVYRNRSASDLSTLKALYASKKGAYGSFTWDNPEDSTTYTVRFKEDSFKYDLTHYGLYSIEFDLIEVK